MIVLTIFVSPGEPVSLTVVVVLVLDGEERTAVPWLDHEDVEMVSLPRMAE